MNSRHLINDRHFFFQTILHKNRLICLQDHTCDRQPLPLSVDNFCDLLIGCGCFCKYNIRRSRHAFPDSLKIQRFSDCLPCARRGRGIVSDHGRICNDRLCKRLHCCISDNRCGFIQADQGKSFCPHPNLSHSFFQCCPYPMNIGNGPLCSCRLTGSTAQEMGLCSPDFSDTDFCCRISNINSGNICQSRIPLFS